MKLDINFSGVENARRSIGAGKAAIDLIRNTEAIENPFEIRLIEEVEIVLSGEELLEQLTCPAGLLAIGNVQITLHIYDPFVDSETLTEVPADNPKFHICDCRKLEEMKAKGRFNRYVTSRRADGYFKVRPYNHLTKSREEELAAALMPCRYCLMQLNYQGYESVPKAQRDKIVSDFSVEEFFEDSKSIFRCLPLYTPETFPEGNYTSAWGRISGETRRRAEWKCSCCGVNCESDTGLLHTHHKDGNRGNDRPSNHKVLCLVCHKNQPLHGHMKIKPDEELRLQKLRKSQGLAPCSC